MRLYPQAGYHSTITLVLVQIPTKPLPTLARPHLATTGSTKGSSTYHQGLTGASVTQSLSLLLGHQLLSALLMAIRLTNGVYAKPLPIQRSSGLLDSGVRQDDTPSRSLIVTRWISPNLAQPHRYEHTIRQFTQKCHPSHLTHISKIPHFPIPHTHTFFL